jgi:hypothetical protein
MCGQQVTILVTPVSAQALKKDYTHQLTSDPTSQSATKSVVIQRCHTHKKMPPSQGVIQTNQPPNQCHTKVSPTHANASKSRCHANKSATKSVSYKSVTHTRKCLQVKVSCKQISHQISVIQKCHPHTQMPPSQGVIQTNQPPNQLSWKGVIHTSQSATNSNAAHRGTVPTSAIDGKVPFEEQHACGLQSLDGPSNVDGSFYKTRQWGHQAPTMCWGGLAHPISSCTSTTAGSYAQPSVPFSTSV